MPSRKAYSVRENTLRTCNTNPATGLGVRKAECAKAPFTCDLISHFAPAAGCKRGQVKFSVVEPNTHIWPHCGPTNCRLRAHLGLVVPDGGVSIRVAGEVRFVFERVGRHARARAMGNCCVKMGIMDVVYRTWKEGEVMVFDDSFEHEVWHNGTSLRLVLIVDVWHPELRIEERETLVAI